MSDPAFLIQTAAAVYMTGVIWIVQLLVYPSFAAIDPAKFAAHHRAHTTRITPLVAPAMILEIAAAGWNALYPPSFLGRPAAFALFVLAALAWLSTFFLQVPAHDALARGFDADAHRRLVSTNWIRTAVWTARAVALGGFLASIT